MGANAQTSVPAFTAGQVLTAAQVTQINTGIPVFESSTERDAAFGGSGEKTLAEGQMAYLEDTNATQYYDGSSWAAVAGGKIIQVVSTTKTDTFTATIAAAGGSASVTGLTAAITPSSATSNILVMVDINGTRDVGGGNGYPQVTFSITRGGTAISVGDTAGSRVSITNGIIAPVGGVNSLGAASATFLDSPSTTSSTTYGVDIHSLTSSTNVTYYVNRSVTDTSSVTYPRATSTITVMEVSA